MKKARKHLMSPYIYKKKIPQQESLIYTNIFKHNFYI